MKKIFYNFLYLTYTIGYSSISLQAQIISTIAGTGIAGYSGDGIPATTSEINNPHSVRVDRSGNVYIADLYNYRIRKINTSGIISTLAGTGTFGFSGDGGPATMAEISNPAVLAIDDKGDVFFSDVSNQRIREITVDGTIITVAGNGVAGFNGDGGSATSASLYNAQGLAIDNSGNLYIADAANYRVRMVDTTGIINTIAGNGSTGFSGDGGPATLATLGYPNFLAIDNEGNLFITDNSNSVIRQVNTSGIINTIAGNGTYSFSGDGGSATLAGLNYPAGIAVDNHGNLFIDDYQNNKIRIVNASGTINTYAGNGTASYSGDSGPAILASLNNPTDMDVDCTGDVFISDFLNNRIRKVNFVNYAPTFISGTVQNLPICQNALSVPINSLFAITDSNYCQLETWSINSTPTNGTLIGFSFSAYSNGGIVLPTGLTYTPTIGYLGSDVFTIQISDGIDSTTTTINVTIINTLPNAGNIIGVDSVCPGHMISLTDTGLGGVWSSSNISISVVGSTGTITGISSGIDTIAYIVTNACGSDTATFPFQVRLLSLCSTGLNNISKSNGDEIKISSNPNNGEFTVFLSSVYQQEVNYTITNVIGEKIKQFIGLTNSQLDVKLAISPGMYFLTAITTDGTWYRKIIIQ